MQPRDFSENYSKKNYFLKELINFYKELQQVTMRYKVLQKIDMDTILTVA